MLSLLLESRQVSTKQSAATSGIRRALVLPVNRDRV